MQTIKFLLCVLGLSFASSAFAQDITSDDLSMWSGIYKGTLTYLDYSSNERVQLKTVSAISNAKNRLSIDILISEWGDTYKQHYDYRLNEDGFAGYSLMCNVLDTNTGIRTIKVAKEGRDDRHRCVFLLTFSGTADVWSIKKEVRYKGETDFFVRNQYDFVRTTSPKSSASEELPAVTSLD